MNTLRDIDYFPAGYIDSRTRFLGHAARVRQAAKRGRWLVPSRTESDLTVDHVYLAPLGEPRTLFVITSGVHGSEGYAGSAIQSMFFQEILPRMDRSHTGVFLAHAMNPYGFKIHRRGTESNVNLNRNCSVSGAMYKERNEVAQRFNQRFLARRPVSSMKSALFERMLNRDGSVFFDDISLDQLIKGIGPGQFERPEDLEFGGFGPEPQTEALIQQMRELVPLYKDLVLFDLHTGLGERDRLHLLIDKGERDLNPRLFKELFDLRADREYYEFTPPEAEGFYEVHGSLNSVLGDLAGPSQRVCALTMEFGTLGHSLEAQLDGLNCFIVEHEGYVYGYADSGIQAEVQRQNFERSYPNRDDWRMAVIGAARGTFENVFRRAGALKETKK
jgi:hypothetical protein